MTIAALADYEQVEAAEAASGLRLALFSGNYNYTRDGANQALNRLVDFLERAGATVRVYAPTTDSPAFEPCGELISVPSLSLPGRPEYRLALGLPRAIRQDVLRFQPTAIHLSAPDWLGFQARNFGRRLGLPVVSSLHTRFETYLSYYGLGWCRPAAERYLNRFYGGCDRILAPSPQLGDELASQGLGERVRVWARGVDRLQFSPAHRDFAWRRAQGLADDDVAAVFLGRVVLEKGLDIFVSTMGRLAETSGGRRVRPLVIGDGPALPWLREQLPEAIFTGMLVGHDLGRAVAGGDILFSSSRTETFGNATLEAMAAGLAVVCPEAPSSRALISNGVDGLVVGEHTAGAYAQAIRSLADDDVHRRRMGDAARKSSARYDWSQCCASVLSVYGEIGALAAR